MKHIKINETTLRKIIKNTINEVMLGPNDRFTPYTPEQAKMNKSEDAFNCQNNSSYLNELNNSLHIKSVIQTNDKNVFEFIAELFVNKSIFKGTYENGNATLKSITTRSGNNVEVTPKLEQRFKEKMCTQLIPQIKARIARGAFKKTELNEAKRKLKSNKLHTILKQHGGLKYKDFGVWLNNLTDDDIITVLKPNDDSFGTIRNQEQPYLENGQTIDRQQLRDGSTLVYKINNQQINNSKKEHLKRGEHDAFRDHSRYQRQYSPNNDKGYERELVKFWKENGAYNRDGFYGRSGRDIQTLKNNTSLDRVTRFDKQGNYIK